MKIMKLCQISWRNLRRNKIRSGVILIAIAIGLFAGTYLSAFMSGWVIGTVNDEIAANLSHIQIHDTAFPANSDITAFFPMDTVTGRLNHSGLDVRVSNRLKLTGMLASANNAVGIAAKAVFPESEREVSTLWKEIPDSLGTYLPCDAEQSRSHPIVISQKTADKLKVKLKSKIVFTFQDVNGDMQSLAFRVCGVFHTSNGMFDEANVFVRYGDIFAATGLPEGSAHETAITAGNSAETIRETPLQAVDETVHQIKAMFPELSVQDWAELNPYLSLSMQWTDMMTFVILGIFLLALSFGIINTMLMAVLERTRELGMLGAIGMSKNRIFGMIMLETVFLTLAGSLVGVALATLFIIPGIHGGVDLTFLTGDSLEDYGFGSTVYPVLNVKMFVEIILLVIVAGILSAIYPARKALMLKPLEAIRAN